MPYHLIRILGFLLAGTLLHAAPRPNIILCMADDMGWGDPFFNSTTVTTAMGTPHPDQGWISTPTMNAMAANGLRFDRFYAASAVCSPTRASCLTGRNPFRVGIPTANAGRLGFDETPLSVVLSAAGYRCGHFGKWHLGSMTTRRADSNRGGDAAVYSAPWHHAYDACFATESKVPTYHPYRRTNNSLPLPTSFSDPNFYGTHYWRMPVTWNFTMGEGAPVPVNEINNALDGDDSKLLVDQAIPFLRDAVAQEQPFFLVLWFHTPHKPLVDPDGVSAVDSSDAVRDAIEDLDLALGRLRNELGRLGVQGNTMFWVTSDNGPEDGANSPNESNTVRSIRSGRFLERKRSLHEGGLRVPGILEWPDVIPAGRITDVPAITSDYYPTILDYLELSVSGQKPLDGISLRPLIEGTATTRSKPIGFLFDGDRSWVNHRYKLIDDGSGWELYDLRVQAAGDEVEQTALATTADLSSRPATIQNVFNTMLAEFNAWHATVATDTPYLHSSQPSVTLAGPAVPVEAPFLLTATFHEAVTGLQEADFTVTNGAVSDLAGTGTTWTVTVTPGAFGPVTISLPEGAVFDADGNPNPPAAPLTVEQRSTLPATAAPISTVLRIATAQTVDRLGNVPADLSNNLLKFTAGTVNDGVTNPFTTALYLRSSTSSTEADARTVRAFARFDLAPLRGLPIANASLHFVGHSLNDLASNDANLEAIALGSPWSVTGPPIPLFNHPTIGIANSGGSLLTNLAPTTHTRTYQLDLTTAARAWASQPLSNHGVQIRLNNQNVNNGAGIRTTGPGAIELIVVEQPLAIVRVGPGPGANDLTLTWTSVPGLTYGVETTETLDAPWIALGSATAPAGPSTSFTQLGAFTNHTPRFYRIVYPPE